LLDVVPGLNELGADAMLDLATEVRKGYKMGECYDTISTRSLIQWGKMWVAYDECDRPFVMSIYAALNSHDQHYVEGLFEAKLGHTLELPTHMKPIQSESESESL